MTRRWQTDSRGVSTIIGAILIAALLVTTLVTVQISFVPVWQKASENARLRVVEGQLASLRADMDRQVDNRTSSSLAHPLTMGSSGAGFFGGPAVSDSVRFHSSTQTYTTASNQFLILTNNGINIAGLNPQWKPFPSSAPVDDIVRVDALRLRVQTMDRPAVNEDLWANLDVTDSTNQFVGRFNLSVENPTGAGSGANDYMVIVNVTDAADTVITRIVYTYANTLVFEPYYEDALNSIYLFDQLLASASAPFSLSLTHTTNFPTQYDMSYVAAGPGGVPILTGTSGILKPDYEVEYVGGYLEYEVTTRRLPAQSYIFEHGALILAQDGEGVFKVPPLFQADRANDQTALTLNLPVLSGNSFSRSGSTNALVVTTASEHTAIEATCPRFEITVQSLYPHLWGAFWNETLDAAGLDATVTTLDPNPEYRVLVDRAAGTANLVVYGSTDLPGDELDFDVSVVLKQATVTINAEV